MGDHPITVEVTDAAGATASKRLTLRLAERPNRWYETARLVALIHGPEANPKNEFTRFAKLMKRQGYGLGMAISYNNGLHRHRWPNPFCPECPLGDCMTPYKKALEAEGVRFGMYFGNFNGDNHGGTDGALLLVEDALKKFQPKAIWFDWLGRNEESLDSLFSMIKSRSPETVIVVNGIARMNNGDWDVICLEGWSAWGDEMWKLWPFHFQWPKRPVIESWRLVADPEFDYSKDVHPDWREYLRVQLSLIGQGFVANIDHSPTIRSGYPKDGPRLLKTLDDSPVWKCHEKMAAWASPEGIPPLYESYTQVTPGPLMEGEWGYSTLNLARDAVYLHVMRDGRGKEGFPAEKRLEVGPLESEVSEVVWMNANRPIPFRQQGNNVTLDLTAVTPDEIDTILKNPAEGASRAGSGKARSFPSDRNAFTPSPAIWPTRSRRSCSTSPARRKRGPAASAWPTSASTADPKRVRRPPASGPGTYEVDLEKVHEIARIVVEFKQETFATKYDIQLSPDGKQWTTVASVDKNDHGGVHPHKITPTAGRYIRVRSFKPDGPNQPGKQMQVRELEVYGGK